MQAWNIKYRSADGVRTALIEGITLEAVEDTFQLWLMETEQFGVILTAEPVDGSLVALA